MTLKKIVDNGLCLGCGFCALNPYHGPIVSMVYNRVLGHFVPAYLEESENSKFGASICPGLGYKIKTAAEKIGNNGQYSIDLGYVQTGSVCTVKNKKIEVNGSSTGAIILFAAELIEKRLVDGFVVTKFNYTKDGPQAVGFIAKNIQQLQESQGSKYCPVEFSEVVRWLKNQTQGSYGIIGTPCQIASIRKIQESGVDLRLKFFLGVFCGGIKSNNNINRLIDLTVNKPNEVTEFRFREGGQPGGLLVKTKAGESRIPYPEYVKMTGFSKLKRCHFCVDATGELADISFGDAWIPRFQDLGVRASILLTRNERLDKVVEDLSAKSLLEISPATLQEIVMSQQGNLESKKYRQRGRLLLYRILGHRLPIAEEGFHRDVNYNLILELRIWLSHNLKQLAERSGLFNAIYYKNKFVHKVLVKVFSDIYN